MASILALFTYNDIAACFNLHFSMSFHHLTTFVIKRWPEVQNRMYLGYAIPNLTSFCELNNEEDFTNMLEMVKIHVLKQVNITVHRSVGESSRLKDYSSLGDSNSASVSTEICSALVPELDVIEDNRPILMTYRWRNCILGVNQIFPGGADEFRNSLIKFSLYKGFTYNLVKNHSKKVLAVCTHLENRNCTWRIQGNGDDSNSLFYIKKYTPDHTCGSEAITRKFTRGHSSIVAEIVEEKMRTNPMYRPVDCRADIEREYGLDISYGNAWLAIEKAKGSFYGEYTYSFDQLRLYCDVAKECNSGSHIVFEIDSILRFKRLFMSFNACIIGFQFCRPILFVDSTFLTGRFRGQLFGATAKDGNNGLFPVAYAIVDSENKDNWLWFMQQLEVIFSANRTIVFVSDRNEGIVNAVSTVFPQSPHGFCTTHLKTNMRGYMGQKSAEVKEAVIKMFDKIIYAKTLESFNRKMQKLKNMCGKRVIEMLDKLQPEHYFDAFFPGQRYGETTSNAAESFNKKFKDERQLPLYGLVDGIRLRLMKDMAERRDTSTKKWKSIICPKIDQIITARMNIGRTWKAVKASDYLYEVKAKRTVMVDLQAYTCTCRAWQVDSLPCAHALSAILKSKMHLIQFIDPYYLTHAYRKVYDLNISPIPTLEMPRSDRTTCQVWPPKGKAQPGRPKKTRNRSFGEFAPPARKMKCSNCKQLGHNQKGCRQCVQE